MGNLNTARIFKEEIDNPAIWNTIILDLGLPKDTDEICIKSVCHVTESMREHAGQKKDKK